MNKNEMVKGFLCGLVFAVLVVLLGIFAFSRFVEIRRKRICLNASECASPTELRTSDMCVSESACDAGSPVQ